MSGNRNFVVIQSNVTNDIIIDGEGNTLTLRAEESGGAVNFKTSGVERKRRMKQLTSYKIKETRVESLKPKRRTKREGVDFLTALWGQTRSCLPCHLSYTMLVL